MASYRDKINQKRMSTESGKIAWCLEWINCRDRKLKWDLMLGKNEIELFDNISICDCEGHFVWEIIRTVPYKPNRYCVKYVQQGLFWEDSKRMLDAQPWKYI